LSLFGSQEKKLENKKSERERKEREREREREEFLVESLEEERFWWVGCVGGSFKI
jgi:hypothetical protein